MAAAPGNYDFRATFYTYAPGVLLTRDIDAALGAQYAANGYTPLTQSQILAIAGTLPTFPATMKRFVDSNPDPRDGSALDNRSTFT